MISGGGNADGNPVDVGADLLVDADRRVSGSEPTWKRAVTITRSSSTWV